MGNVIHRGKGSFTFVENTIFFDHGLSAKAKGIYCPIRSLENNPEWVFTIKGFASLVRDGADAVSAGIKELESSGYIIRARKRSENGRFLKAEEATWITLDDPAMHAQIAAELKADGYAILSEFTREPPANVEFEPSVAPLAATNDIPEKGQVGTRTRKPVSGKATSGESAPINYSYDKALEPDKEPLSCLPDESAGEAKRGRGDFRKYRKGEFPEAFERLCAMSLKPVASLRFKRDCLVAWSWRVAQGFSPEQIIDAYAAYAKSFWMRNGDDTTLAKNLARWLEGEGGLTAYSDESIPPGPPGCRRRTARHGGPRPGRPGVREDVAQGRDAPQRNPLPDGRRWQAAARGTGARRLRRGQALPALSRSLPRAPCALSQDIRPLQGTRDATAA